MDLRARLIGALLVACGLALCYGAVALWSPQGDASPGTAYAIARFVGAAVAALFGVGNVFAGLILVLRRTVRT